MRLLLKIAHKAITNNRCLILNGSLKLIAFRQKLTAQLMTLHYQNPLYTTTNSQNSGLLLSTLSHKSISACAEITTSCRHRRILGRDSLFCRVQRSKPLLLSLIEKVSGKLKNYLAILSILAKIVR